MNRLGNITRVLMIMSIIFLIQYYIGIPKENILIELICVSIVEEILKFIFVIDKDNLNDTISIVVYFAMIENILYCYEEGAIIQILFIRTITTLNLHLFCTLVAYLGYKKGYTILGLITAITTHTIFNLYVENNLGNLLIIPMALIFIYIFFNRKSLIKVFNN